jgi:hypothetical protein
MSDADVERVFDTSDDNAKSAIRSGTEALIALLYLGGIVGGDDMGYRFRSGIARAEAARGNHAEVDFDVRTAKLRSPQETMAKLEAGKDKEVSYPEIERLWMTDDVSADRVAKWEAQLTENRTVEAAAEDLRTEREALSAMVRYPIPTLIDRERLDSIDIHEESPDD